MEVGYHTWSFASLPLDKALKHIKDAGFVEVEINADGCHLDPRIYPRQELAKLRALLNELLLHPNSVHAPINGADLSTAVPEKRLQTIRLMVDTLEYCRAIDCPIAVMHPNHSDSLPLGAEAMKNNSVKTLIEIIDKAEDFGVKIALENMIDKGERRFGSRVADLLEIIEDVGSPDLGICFDAGHTNIIPNSDVSLKDEIIQARGRLWTLHVHDNDGKIDCHWPPGDGNIDWSKVVEGLRIADYRGVFMMEVQERGEPDELARRSRQKAIKILGVK